MKRNNPSFRVLFLPVLLALALTGCSKHEESPPPPPPKPEQAKKPAGAPGAAQKQLSSARTGAKQLDFHNRVDPFKPFAPVVVAPQPKGGEPAARPAADLLPIQSFEVSRFKVSGIIAGLRENRALIIDPNGKGYVVQEGMQIGSNNGRISRISASTVEVVESFKDERGKLRKRTTVLSLAKKR